MFPHLDIPSTYLAQHITTAGQVLNDLHDDLHDLDYLNGDLDHTSNI